jgi:hypothetical protein
VTISPPRLGDVPLQASAREGRWLEADDPQTVKALHQREREQSNVRSYVEDDVAISDGYAMSLVTPIFENLSKDKIDPTADSAGAPNAKTVRAPELFHRQSIRHGTPYSTQLKAQRRPDAILLE